MLDSTLNPLSVPPSAEGQPPDQRPLPEIVASGKPEEADSPGWPPFALAYHDVEGKRYYAVQDWIIGVAQTDNARDFWLKMKRRLKKAKIELRTWCRQLPCTARDDKKYMIDHATVEGIYFIAERMSVMTPIRSQVLGVPVDNRSYTQSGYLYVLHAAQFPDEYKIGVADNLEIRLSNYRMHTPPSLQLIVDYAFFLDNCRHIEREAHRQLAAYRLRGEWFKLDLQQIEELRQWLVNKETQQ